MWSVCFEEAPRQRMFSGFWEPLWPWVRTAYWWATYSLDLRDCLHCRINWSKEQTLNRLLNLYSCILSRHSCRLMKYIHTQHRYMHKIVVRNALIIHIEYNDWNITCNYCIRNFVENHYNFMFQRKVKSCRGGRRKAVAGQLSCCEISSLAGCLRTRSRNIIQKVFMWTEITSVIQQETTVFNISLIVHATTIVWVYLQHILLSFLAIFELQQCPIFLTITTVKTYEASNGNREWMRPTEIENGCDSNIRLLILISKNNIFFLCLSSHGHWQAFCNCPRH